MKKMFSSSSEVSFGRFAAGLALIAALAWVTYIVIKKLELPSLQGIATLVGSLYGSSKLGDVVTAIKGTKTTDPPGGAQP
jgi:hypothetical protein